MARKSFTNIFEAVRKGTVEDVQYFIEQQCVDVNAKDNSGNTPLHIAVQHWHGDNEMIEFFISHRVNVLTRNKKRRTARICAMIKMNTLTANIADKANLLTQVVEPGNVESGNAVVTAMSLLTETGEMLQKVKRIMKVIKMLENAEK